MDVAKLNNIYREIIIFRPVPRYAKCHVPNVPIVELTVTATEKTRDIISNSLEMVDPVIISLK